MYLGMFGRWSPCLRLNKTCDFFFSWRTQFGARLKALLLLQEGILVVGGNSRYEVSISLHDLALKQQSLMGIGKGSREQLEELVQLIASQQVS